MMAFLRCDGSLAVTMVPIIVTFYTGITEITDQYSSVTHLDNVRACVCSTLNLVGDFGDGVYVGWGETS